MSDYDEYRGHPELQKSRTLKLFFRRIGIGALVLYMVLSSALQTYNTILSFSSRHAILDCTQPSGTCYRQKVARTDSNNLILQHQIVRTVVCLFEGAKTEPKINSCIERLAKKEGQ